MDAPLIVRTNVILSGCPFTVASIEEYAVLRDRVEAARAVPGDGCAPLVQTSALLTDIEGDKVGPVETSFSALLIVAMYSVEGFV